MPGTVQLFATKGSISIITDTYVLVHRSSVSLLHTALFTREHAEPLRQYCVGCVVENICKQVMPQSRHSLTTSHAHSHHCLISLLFYTKFFNLKIIFTCNLYRYLLRCKYGGLCAVTISLILSSNWLAVGLLPGSFTRHSLMRVTSPFFLPSFSSRVEMYGCLRSSSVRPFTTLIQVGSG